jgi:Tfp pilus assembly protein PilF
MRQTLRAQMLFVASLLVVQGMPGAPRAVIAATGASQSSQSRGSPAGIIEGRVTGPNRRPIQNARVELLNDSYSPVSSNYTDGSGRFRFRVSPGVYHIDVEAQGQPLERRRERLEVNPLGQMEIFRVDVQLAAVKSKSDSVQGSGGVRFYQKVPDDARTEYERGVGVLKTNPDEAYAALRKALQLFPDYYQAMETLGSEYVKAGHLEYALPLLTRAVEVNAAGEMSHYALGVLHYKRSSFADSAKEFSRVLELNPNAVNATLYLGLAHTRENKLAEAERMLKKASELGAKNVPDLHLALASIYSKTNRYRQAADELDRLLKENPERSDKEKLRELIQNLRSKAQQK